MSRTTVAIHMTAGDRAQVVHHESVVWIEIIGAHQIDGVPIHARSAEQFEALADACEQAATKMRAQLVAERTVGATIEAAG